MARTIIGATFMSLDGVVQGPGGPNEDITGNFDEGGWVFKLWDDEVGSEIDALFTGDFDLLLGRRTYEIFAAYWPYVEGEGAEMGKAFTRANKYVLTRGNQPLEWANSHRLTGIDQVAALKQGDGPKLIIQGSSTIYPGLLAAGLLDRLILMTFPITLGKGKRLFGEGVHPGLLKLAKQQASEKGTVILTYEPGGSIPPYPELAPEQSTSNQEAERQSRMKAGTW